MSINWLTLKGLKVSLVSPIYDLKLGVLKFMFTPISSICVHSCFKNKPSERRQYVKNSRLRVTPS